MNKKLCVLGLLIIFIMSACNNKKTEQQELIILSTTSTENSGLFNYILPVFEKESNIKTKVVAVGTGKALQMGKDGEGDILIVHDKEKEIEFVKEGHGIDREDLMYNEFVLLGPENTFNNLNEAFTYIADNNKKFISRGDKSGTHSKELSIWEKLNIDYNKEWYVSSGTGMGSTIQMANEMLGYTLSDKATFLAMKNTLDIGIVFDKDEALYNQYGVILINPNKNHKINHKGAKIFKEWLLSDKGQSLIAEFGVEEFGEALFSVN